MGGRIHGFLGGVLLTSALTYYTGEYIKKNKEFVSQQLKASNNIINENILSDASSRKLPEPEDKSIQYTSRAGVLETSKDIWNNEIISAVNWLYSIDWYKWGVVADEKLVSLSDKIAEQIVPKKN
ncbi:Piso0_004399 [Millerozyma farinosa CBS 7064]|uniref:MICOS complex subunit MIC12 n=1 Tax=Pichia sorbitophila (strain ATCC MYA-4447 / BCRC 22081 / CBS 7064 / NBRC 10061 / NRRL Y-12695) TaxID=559304 RepID=G8Y8P6_PICSO|nr:Piso0_004399 [Millerozyma farinosa CBS 7064]CCE84841.1 Piso0_004399 [Millerozyma farinosa CBS 7064]